MSRPKLLLVGWDSADWKVLYPLVDRGQMPMLRRVVESGVSGNLRTLEPVLSPMLWTSIATGKRAYDHGVLGFTEVDALSQRVQPVTASTRRCAALWNILAAQGLKCHVLGWFATHGEQIPGGGVVSNLFPAPTAKPGEEWPPAPRGTIWPEGNAEVLNELRVSPEDIEGDTIGLFCPRWAEIDTTKDHRLNHLRIHLAEAFSIQAAACWTLENTEWDFTAVYFRAIDEIAHHFMPYHPLKLDGVPQTDFELYQEVINSTCRMHDLMLARLISLAGPDTHVMLVSDHGFHSDHLRPKFVPRVPAGITVWHRDHGIFAAAGPKFAKDELVHGASLLDIAPTVLQLFDLPIGRDMEGRVLADAFVQMPDIKTVPTWEGPQTAHARASSRLSDAENQALIEQFAALGYLEKPTGNPNRDAAQVDRENRWSLARALMDGGRYIKALPLLEDLHHEAPERTDFAQLLARCQIRLGLLDEAQQSMDAILETSGNAPVAAMLRAQIALERRDAAQALKWLDTARSSTLVEEPRFWRQLCFTLISLRCWPQAREAAEKLIQLDPEDSQGHLGLAIAHLHQNRPDEAIECALQATALDFHLPRAHFILARALLRLRDLERAEQALRTALKIMPAFPQALQLLAALCRASNRWQESQNLLIARLGILNRRVQQVADMAKWRAEAAELARNSVPSTKPPEQPAASSAFQPLDIVIVTGLPRSGTSLMMQMLHAGGHPVLTDGKRAADTNNERGYFEWEEIKRLPNDPRVIEQAAGKAVKVVTPLLPHLPGGHRYKFIVMRRPLTEVARSQQVMRFGKPGTPGDLEDILPLLEKHWEGAIQLLGRVPENGLLEVDYPSLVRDPLAWVGRLVAFMGEESLPQRDQMASVVKPQLHRQRSA